MLMSVDRGEEDWGQLHEVGINSMVGIGDGGDREREGRGRPSAISNE